MPLRGVGNWDVIPVFHRLEYCFDIQRVNWALVPEPSERTMGVMALSGIARAGLSAVMALSFQRVIWPRKIFVITSPESRRFVTRLPPILRLYMNEVPPATIGM